MAKDLIPYLCPYCDEPQHFHRPKEKGLEVCRDCNRTMDTYADGTIKKSNLDYAEPGSVSAYGNRRRPMCHIDIVTGKEK